MERMDKGQRKVMRAMATLNNLMAHKMRTQKDGDVISPLHLWWGCPHARFDHAREGRVFAHTNHLRGVVCICDDLCSVNDAYLYGILAHEFGHELAFHFRGDYSEEGADRAVKDFLGLDIRYGTPLCVQYLNKENLALLESFRSEKKVPPSLFPPAMIPRDVAIPMHHVLYNMILGAMQGTGDDFLNIRSFCKKIIDDSFQWLQGGFPRFKFFHGGKDGEPDDFIVFLSDGVGGQIDFSPHAYDLESPKRYKKGHLIIEGMGSEVMRCFLQQKGSDVVSKEVDEL